MERIKGKSLLLFPADYCIIDIETTGLDPAYCEIIEIAALRIRNGGISAQFSELVKPSEPIDSFITELTGITNDMLKDASPLSDVLPAFRSFVGSDLLVGHNVHFDINFLYDGSEQLCLSRFHNNFIDTMRIARIVLPELPHHRLKDLAGHYQIINPQEHRAEGDCLTTFELLKCLQADAEFKQIDLSQYPLKKSNSHKGLRAKDLSAQTSDFDESHPLYRKMCVFTGALSKMKREEAMQLVLDAGGQCGDNVTQKTDYLIVGNTEYCSNMHGSKTSKMKKAEELILKGYDLTIISESVFYDLIEGYSCIDSECSKDEPVLSAQDDSCASAETAGENVSVDYDQLVRLIAEMMNKTAQELNAPDGFFDLVENQKSHSLWIVEPMTRARSQMVLTVEKRGKAGQKYGRISAKKALLDKIKAQHFTVSGSDPMIAYLDMTEIKTKYTDQLRKLIQYSAENFTPSERFGCCHLYRECSATGKCLHSDLFYARACWYRKNLEDGKIFY